jgi:hypothetical protein
VDTSHGAQSSDSHFLFLKPKIRYHTHKIPSMSRTPSPMLATSPTYLILLDIITLIMFGEEYNL